MINNYIIKKIIEYTIIINKLKHFYKIILLYEVMYIII